MAKFINICILVIVIVIAGYLYFEREEPRSEIEGYSNELFQHIKEGKDNFSWDQLGNNQKAVDCYNLKPNECMNYSNCGLCLKKGQKPECVPGDVQGPLFKGDCDGWAYTNYYDRHIFGEKVTTITPPWSMFYSDYEAWYPMTGRAPLIY